ncbi:MAG: ABC transporter permease [Phycisphaerae bacterium]|nr:ABC transporter permease [Phycisphaerae bacterium]
MLIPMPRALIRSLWGPVLDKELRVSSRRRRSYVVRTAYLALLTLFVALVWADVAEWTGPGIAFSAWMARVGRWFTLLTVWFQFVACQVVAAVLCSTAISEEVQHRTLGVLMTTPVSSLQIVLGKLLSRLFQTWILIGLSLPLLALVRVYGGIPWGFLIGGLALTASAAMFAGSVSLFLSIVCGRAYAVILWSVLGLIALWGLVPFLTFLLADAWDLASERQCLEFFTAVHPYFGLAELSDPLMGRMGGAAKASLWIRPSAGLLVCSAALLVVSVARVRTVALRQVTGGVAAAPGRAARRASRAGGTHAGSVRVHGCPVLWKERRAPLLGRRRGLTLAGLILTCGALVPVYWAAYDGHDLDDSGFHSLMVFLYMLLGGLFAVVLPATTITTERETGSWPILLSTTLGPWRIVAAKGLGAIRRGLLAWGFLLIHVLAFTITGLIHPLGAVQLALAVLGLVVLLTGTGLYFSSRLRHTTAAVISNLALACVLWVLLPVAMMMGLYYFSRLSWADDWLERILACCPFVQGAAIMEAFANGPYSHLSGWPLLRLDPMESTVWVAATAAIHVLAGCVFALRAGANLRRRIF